MAGSPLPAARRQKTRRARSDAAYPFEAVNADTELRTCGMRTSIWRREDASILSHPSPNRISS